MAGGAGKADRAPVSEEITRQGRLGLRDEADWQSIRICRAWALGEKPVLLHVVGISERDRGICLLEREEEGIG